MAFIILHKLVTKNGYIAHDDGCTHIKFSGIPYTFVSDPEKFIQENLISEDIIINTDNVRYISNCTFGFTIKKSNELLGKGSEIFFDEDDSIIITETLDEINEIIKVAETYK